MDVRALNVLICVYIIEKMLIIIENLGSEITLSNYLHLQALLPLEKMLELS